MNSDGTVEDSDLELVLGRRSGHGRGRWVVDEIAQDVYDLVVFGGRHGSGTSAGGCGHRAWAGGIY